MTSSNGNIFRVTGPLWENSPVTVEFPSQRPVTRSFDVFFFISAYTKGWVNNRDPSDLRHPLAHYDVTVIILGPTCYASTKLFLNKHDHLWQTPTPYAPTWYELFTSRFKCIPWGPVTNKTLLLKSWLCALPQMYRCLASVTGCFEATVEICTQRSIGIINSSLRAGKYKFSYGV